MKKNSFRLFSAFIFASVTTTSCVKDRSVPASPVFARLITDAKHYFEANVANHPPTLYSNNRRALVPRTLQWQNAYVGQLSVGQAIIVPIQYNDIYVTSDASIGRLFALSALAKVVLFRDSSNQFQCRVITYIPDSAASPAASMFTGTAFYEDWQGNSVTHSWHLDSKTLSHPGSVASGAPKHATFFQAVQVCTTINGYNYAADDPDNGEYWSETSCTTYGFDEYGGAGDEIGQGDMSTIYGGGSSRISPLTVHMPPPPHPIADIQNYFHCFVNAGGPDHTFSIQVCVAQPDPGTRQPWTFVAGGPIGSSSAGNFANVGHTFLILSENSQGNIITRNIGFYPSGFVIPSPASAASSQGILNDDQNHTYNISLTIPVSSSDFFGILSYVELGNNPGFYYNINSNNCTTFVINALRENGIILPTTIGSWPGGTGYNPGDLGEDIRQMNLMPGMSRNTVENPHPNTFSCN